eukprot:NODE_7417_length_440_cov_7.910543_g7251_i0.p1 GENE.NODE_7417_length_440_cov_7.910543_g7251_i0~~NODE_7417_length_440_cov_7.910543_g7251_i0.p1  ORF type:complete len:136 (-),score=46.59 NODE_7417_length_440_cov_7.910543_g7251_i0:31-378(-)
MNFIFSSPQASMKAFDLRLQDAESTQIACGSSRAELAQRIGALGTVIDEMQIACRLLPELREWVNDLHLRCVRHSELEERSSQAALAVGELRCDVYKMEAALQRKLDSLADSLWK